MIEIGQKWISFSNHSSSLVLTFPPHPLASSHPCRFPLYNSRCPCVRSPFVFSFLVPFLSSPLPYPSYACFLVRSSRTPPEPVFAPVLFLLSLPAFLFFSVATPMRPFRIFPSALEFSSCLLLYVLTIILRPFPCAYDVSLRVPSMPDSLLYMRACTLQRARVHVMTVSFLRNYGFQCWGLNTVGALGYGDTVTRGDDTSEMGDSLGAVSLGTNVTIMPGLVSTLAPTAAPTLAPVVSCQLTGVSVMWRHVFLRDR